MPTANVKWFDTRKGCGIVGDAARAVVYTYAAGPFTDLVRPSPSGQVEREQNVLVTSRREEHSMARVSRITGAVVLAALVLMGCSGGGPAPAAVETLVPIAPPHRPSGPPATVIGKVKTDKGDAVVDREGYVLYTFDNDAADGTGRPVSNCVDACAEQWPPAITETGVPVARPGISPRDLGVLVRADGTKQVTLAKKPLYRFKGDQPGQTTGHNVDGAWHLAVPR